MKKVIEYSDNDVLTDSTIKLTKEEAKNLGIDLSKLEDNQLRGEIKTSGPWSIITGFKAIAITEDYDRTGMFTKVKRVEVFGPRSLTNIRQGGYELEGYVSIGGKKYSAFTSSQLFEIEDQLINVATIFARM